MKFALKILCILAEGLHEESCYQKICAWRKSRKWLAYARQSQVLFLIWRKCGGRWDELAHGGSMRFIVTEHLDQRLYRDRRWERPPGFKLRLHPHKPEQPMSRELGPIGSVSKNARETFHPVREVVTELPVGLLIAIWPSEWN